MDELLMVNIVVAFSALLPSALLELMNHNKTTDFVGYNTARGLKTQETRKFAVKYATKGMFWAGLSTVITQATLYFLVGGEATILIAALVMTVAFIAVVILTERALIANFDKDGKPKDLIPRY